MFKELGDVALGLFTGVVSLAIISVIVSKQSQTPQVLQATSTALAKIVAAATNPIHTAGTNANLAAPTLGGIGSVPFTSGYNNGNG